MFTGIVECAGRVLSRGPALLKVQPDSLLKGIVLGESISVDGVCLTADRLEGGALQFRLLPETLRATTLGGLKPGGRVNLERSLKAGSRVGGHLLLGHVDGKGKIHSRKQAGDTLTLEISLPPALSVLLAPKGPVAVDGVSLTLGSRLARGRFAVHLIGHTLSVTTLSGKKPGQEVNVEVDPVAKYLWGML